MKIYFALFLCLVLVCCNKQKTDAVKTANAQTTTLAKDSLTEVKNAVVDSSKLIKVIYLNDKGNYYDKEAYKAFGKWSNALNPNYVCAPDVAEEIFRREKFYKQKSNPISKIQSGTHFLYLYANFLQKKNGIESNVELRKKIFRICTLINAVHSNIDFDGGIYFSYQRTFSAAYTEFALYNYIRYNMVFKKEYSIQKQKSLYIQLLKQKVDDELNEMIKKQRGQYWYLNTPEKRKEWRKETLILIKELDDLIETYYDLKIAEQFQYSHYV
ncbi:hypothetical protein [Flavobacterium sp. NRK1]|uniref:hypothetical protein n=1 Tax=Flavobacterium sp. NRK1 TaxID=2954929 RepID=UPI0020926EC7|nr:hypothetical protein [Flavobacterium sp. NRK1]MCO6148853.1 hypothetical protein [Flavobacterium sp. NRK1]